VHKQYVEWLMGKMQWQREFARGHEQSFWCFQVMLAGNTLITEVGTSWYLASDCTISLALHLPH